jgi:hypothetical protein
MSLKVGTSLGVANLAGAILLTLTSPSDNVQLDLRRFDSLTRHAYFRVSFAFTEVFLTRVIVILESRYKTVGIPPVEIKKLDS